MFKLQFLIYSVIISAIVSAGTAGYLAWTWQSNKYELQISKLATKAAEEKAQLQKDIKDATQKVLATERQADEISADADKRAIESSKNIAAVLADNRKLLSDNHRLRIKSESNKDSSSASNSAPSTVDVSSTSTDSSSIELSREFSEFLISSYAVMDELKLYADTCHNYALEVQKQRTEIMKELENE